MNISPLEDQQVLLTAESHLSSPMLSIHFKPFTKLLCIVSLWLATVLKQKLQLGKYMYKFSTTQIYCKQNYCKKSSVSEKLPRRVKRRGSLHSTDYHSRHEAAQWRRRSWVQTSYCLFAYVCGGRGLQVSLPGTLLTLLMTVFSQAWSTPRDPQWPGLQAEFPQVPFSLGSNPGLKGEYFTDWAHSLTLVVSILGRVTREKPRDIGSET